MSAPWSLSGAKRTSGKLYSTSVSHNHAASQLPYPRADSLPRSGLVQYMLCDPNIVRHNGDGSKGAVLQRGPVSTIPAWCSSSLASISVDFLASHCAVLAAGPARMAEYFPIDLPFPRALPIKTTDEFGAYARRIYASLGLATEP